MIHTLTRLYKAKDKIVLEKAVVKCWITETEMNLIIKEVEN